MRKIHMIRTHLSKYDHTDKCSQICTYRTQRNIVCQEKQSEKYNCTDHKNPPVKGNHKSYRCSYALPALKIKIKRKIMPQNTPSCCIKAQKRQNISIRISEYCPYDQDGAIHFRQSHNRFNAPAFLPSVRSTFVEPRFPLPVCEYQYDKFFLKCMRSEKVRMHIQLQYKSGVP